MKHFLRMIQSTYPRLFSPTTWYKSGKNVVRMRLIVVSIIYPIQINQSHLVTTGYRQVKGQVNSVQELGMDGHVGRQMFPKESQFKNHVQHTFIGKSPFLPVEVSSRTSNFVSMIYRFNLSSLYRFYISLLTVNDSCFKN